MSGCSNKEWLKKVECQVILHIERGFSKSVHSANEDFEFLGIFLIKKLANQKWTSSKMDTSAGSTKDPD
jgi:hypothetical protein